MSDFDDEDQKLVLTIIKQNPGCGYELLYQKSCLERVDLSSILHKLNQQMAIYKDGKEYYAIGIAKNKTAEVEVLSSVRVTVLSIGKSEIGPSDLQSPMVGIEISKPVPVQTVTTTPVRHDTRAPALPKPPEPSLEKVYGAIHRSGSKGVIALFFYQNRKEDTNFDLHDLRKELPTFDLGNISTILWQLARDGYIETKDAENAHGKRYVWTNKFIYPFSKILPQDSFIIPKKELIVSTKAIAEFDPSITESAVAAFSSVDSGDTSNVAPIVEDKTIAKELLITLSSSNNDVLMVLVDTRIAALNSELSNLLEIKRLLIEDTKKKE